MFLKIARFSLSLFLPILFLKGCLPHHIESYFSTPRVTTGENVGIAVQRGDNLYQISKRYDVTLRDLIEINNLNPPYSIYPGQGLRLPKKRIHIVRCHETVESIARKRHVNLHGLVTLNSLKSPYKVHENQRLKLPYPIDSEAKIVKKPSLLKGGGEKLDPVEKQKKIEPLLPLAKQLTKSLKIKKSSKISKFPIEGHLTLPPEKPFLKKNTSFVSQKKIPSKAQNSSRKLKPISKFQWPVRGKILAKYGKKSGGLRNDGMNIAAQKGTSIRAAEQGYIVYTGNALKGYGNLILIKHRHGWITTYAHCNTVLVSKGSVVKKGQKIATIGQTGNVKRPQLHFEIRKKARTVNPVQYLR